MGIPKSDVNSSFRVFIIPIMLNGGVCYQKHHVEAPQTLCKPFSESNPPIDTQNHYESL